MATSRTVAAGLAAVATALSGCGGGGGGPAGTGARAASPTSAPARGAPAGFAWLHPGPAPTGWPVAVLARGAAMPYPPGWNRTRSDRGTATAVTEDSRGQVIGYLNLTPRQGSETLQTWARFRVEHNADEHEHNVATLTQGTALRFRSGTGSCVRDAYTTATGARYIELACLVAGEHSSVVVIGASPPRTWSRVAPLLERAISAVVA